MNAREIWLDWRRLGLGGSDVASLLGLSPWSGPWDVYLSKVHAVDSPDSPAMERGRRLERALGEWAADRLALDLRDGAQLEDAAEPWIRGTTDHMLSNPATGDVEGLEVKTTRYLDPKVWGAEGSNLIPIQYRIQVAWYMRLADVDSWRVAVFSTLQDRLVLYRIQRDLEVEAALVDRARVWWKRHVIGGEPPAIDGSAAAGRFLRQKHDDPSDRMLDADPEIEEIARQLRQLHTVRKTAQTHIDKLQNEIKACIGDARGVAGEFGAAKWSRYTQNRLDRARLETDRPDLLPILKQYTKQTPAGRLWLNWKEDKT